MTRIAAAIVTALLGVLLLPTAPAVAATSANVQSPQAQSTVTSPTPIRVQVTSDSGSLSGGEQVSRVEVRLSGDGRATYAGTSIVDLSCISDCGSDSSVWSGGSYDPATGSPFSGREMCNGRYYVQPRVNGGSWGAGVWFVSSVAPAKVIGVRLSATDTSVTVRWTPNSEPDLSGYVVERSTEGGPFREMAEVAAGTTSWVDHGLADGEYGYRVVAVRPDGRSGSSPAAPCADGDADLRATSEAHTIRVGNPPEPEPEPEPEPQPSASPSGDGSADGSDGGSSGGPTGGSGDGPGDASPSPSGSPTEPDASEDEQEPEGDDETSADAGEDRPRSGRRVSAPPRAQRSTSQDLTLPSLPSSGNGQQQASGGSPGYYGENDPYSDELDYGDVPQVAGEADADDPAYRTERIPGEGRTLAQRMFDPEAYRSQWRAVAAGLLLVLLALHLQRWIRASDG